MSVLDAGLTATLSREFASKQHDNQQKIKIFSTLESCYISVVSFIIIFFVFFSGYISTNWLKLNKLNPQDVAFYLKIMGSGIAIQMLCNFYMGGLIGLEKQIKANTYQVGWGVLRNGVVILVLFIKPNLTIFFSWQILTTVIYGLVLRYSVKKNLAGKPDFSFRFTFNKEILRMVGRFTAGMLLISFIQSINTQLDKVLMSKLFNLNELGFYTIANSLAQGILTIVGPVSVALLPRLTSLFTENKADEAIALFHKVYLAISIIVFSFAANLIFNGHNVIYIWTGNMKIADSAYRYVPFLVAGNTLLATLVFPFNIAIANKYTRLNNIIGIVSLLFTIPMYWFMLKKFGPVGASFSWFLLQLLITPVYMYYINTLFLKAKSTLHILIKELLFPAVVALFVAYLFSTVKIPSTGRLIMLLWVGLATIVTLLINIGVFLPRAQIKVLLNLLSVKLKLNKS